VGESKEKPIEVLRAWTSNDSLDACITIAPGRINAKYVTLDGCIWHGRWWRRVYDQLNSNFKN
jgi:hypothetical protein